MTSKPQKTSINTDPVHPPGQRHFKLIACEIIYRELCLLAAQSRHIIDVQFLRKGLHDAGKQTMLHELQEAISSVETNDYDAILLGYGRCSDGIANLRAPTIPLVIPRAHDCITFFFGSRQNYEKYFSQNPGTYYRTTGWTERGDYDQASDTGSVMHQLGLDRTYDEYVARHGKDNARYIMESLGSWEQNYNCLTYIDMGMPQDDEYALLTKRQADQMGLEFKRLTGDLRLLRALMSGQWDEREFLIVRPGRIVGTDDNGEIIKEISD